MPQNGPPLPPMPPPLSYPGVSRPCAVVILICAALYLVGNGRVSLWDRDEPRYAQASRQMAQTERAVLYGRIGLCNQEFGTLASWLVDVVNILTGHFDTPGGSTFPRRAAWSITVQPQPGLEDGLAEFGRFRTRVRGAKEVLGQVPVSCMAEEIATPGEGQLKALITVPCSHCLGPALLKVSVPVNLTFVEPGKDEEDEAAAADPLDDVDVTAHDGVEIDLGAFLREQMILAVPMSPRCRDNCAGLCATCGQNKNERDCGHTAPALEDPRFAALKNLKLE